MSTPVDTARRLSGLDASFLYLERSSQLLHVASILLFEGQLDYERLVADFRARLPLIPRYSERIMPVPFSLAHPTWEPDPEFDLRAHILHRTLRPPGTVAQLHELCAALFAQPLDRSKPLWEMYLIDGYRGGQGPRSRLSSPSSGGASVTSVQPEPEAQSVLFTKVHHCMIDGISGVQLLGVMLDTSPKPPALAPSTFRRRPPLPGPIRRIIDGVADRITTGIDRGISALTLLVQPRKAIQELQSSVDAMTHLLRTLLAGAPQTPLNGRIGIAREFASFTFSLNEAKAIKNKLGGSVNDVVLAVISGALRQILDERGMNPDRMELRAMMPVNVRGTHEHLKLGNRISMMVAPLPVGILDPVERLRQVRTATEQLKARNETAKMERIVQLADLLPPPLQRIISQLPGLGTPINTICTNVPGPPIALYMQGVRVDQMTPFVPLAEGIGVTFAILSYAGTLTIGITADPALVSDLQDVPDRLHTSFEELWAATGLTRVAQREAVMPALHRRKSTPAPSTMRSTIAAPPAKGRLGPLSAS